MPRSTNPAAPVATSTLVRSPAVRWRYCRSAPISIPQTNAMPRLAVEWRSSHRSSVANTAIDRPYRGCRGRSEDLAHRRPASVRIAAGGAAGGLRPTVDVDRVRVFPARGAVRLVGLARDDGAVAPGLG